MSNESCELDRLMKPDEFAKWLGVSKYWVRSRLNSLPGVVRYSREMVRIHPRTFLQLSLEKQAKAA